MVFQGLRSLGVTPEEITALDDAAASALDDADVDLVSSDTAIAERCGSDLACRCQAAREHGADFAVSGNVGRIDRIYSIELQRVETRSCTVEGALFESKAFQPSEAVGEIRRMVAQLLVPPGSVTETVAKADRDVDTAPAIVTVITGKQIRQLGITSLPELFRQIPGFESLDMNWSDRVLYQGLPGTVLLMVDGIPISDGVNNFDYVPRDFDLSLEDLDRVEVIRGPGSVLWGSDALLGIVNFITAVPTRQQPEVTVQARAGSLDDEQLFLRVERSRPAIRYGISTTVVRSRGTPALAGPSPLDPIALSPGRTAGWSGGGQTSNRAGLDFDAKGRLIVFDRLDFQVVQNTTRDPYEISPFGSLLGPRDGGWWHSTRRLLSIALADRLRHGFRYRLSGSRFENYVWEDFVLSPRDPRGFAGGFRALQGHPTEPRMSQILEGRLFHDTDGHRIANHALAGVSLLDHNIPASIASEGALDDPFVPHVDYHARHTGAVAGFAEDELAWGPAILSGGLRYERRQPFPDVHSLQGAAIWKARLATTKLVYSEGYRPPQANDLFSTVGTEGNPKLQPEISHTVALETALRPLPPLVWRAGASDSTLLHLIEPDSASADPGYAYRPVNRGALRVQSLWTEMSLQTAIVSGFGGGSVERLSQRNAGPEIPYAHSTAHGGILVRPGNDFSLFATVAWTSRRKVDVFLPPPTAGDATGLPLVAPQTVPPPVWTTIGVGITELLPRTNLTVVYRNPFLRTQYVPYRVDGSTSPPLERRRAEEVLVTLRWTPL